MTKLLTQKRIKKKSHLCRYITGKHPPGADQLLDEARYKLVAKAREVKELAQNRLEQAGHTGS